MKSPVHIAPLAAMIFRFIRRCGCVVLAMGVFAFCTINSTGAIITAAPGEAGFRAAIAAAQEGDTVMLTNGILHLQSAVRIDKRLTIRVDGSNEWRVVIAGNFEGELLQLAAEGIVFEWIVFHGSAQTDALRLQGVKGEVVLRGCIIRGCRTPVVDDDPYATAVTFRLERVTVEGNQNDFFSPNLEAEDSVFSRNGGGVSAINAHLDGCRVEQNLEGLSLINGTVRNCTFGFNSRYGLYFDPDGGVLSLSGSLFYANVGGGLFVGEDNHVTVENCTFTHHTGLPAIVVTDAEDVLFRHCTVADNLFIELAPSSHPRLGVFVIQNSTRVELQNCLVADNPTNGSPHSAGLAGDWIDGGGNVIGGPARLSVLRDNGGPTLSLLPLADSPAIDAGRASDIVADARGFSRLAGIAPDAGAIETDALPPADTDADGLPDIWERFHQLNPTNSADASSDGDADGQSAVSEFHARTDPTDSQSVFRIQKVALPEPPELQPNLRNVRIAWPFMRGVRYQVEVSVDLLEWRKLPDPGGVFVENGRTMMEYGMPVESTNSFYRVSAVGITRARP